MKNKPSLLDVTSSYLKEKMQQSNPVDEFGNQIKLPEELKEHEKFKAWVENIFDNQTNFANRCGYCRKAINEFCQGKKPIPKALKLVWDISLQNAQIKQELSRLKRRINVSG